MNGKAGTIFMVAYLALEAIMKYEVEQNQSPNNGHRYQRRKREPGSARLCVKICKYSSYSAFSKTQPPLELWLVLSCESPAVFLHTPLEEKGPWEPYYQFQLVLAKGRHLLQILLKALIHDIHTFTFVILSDLLLWRV